MNLEENQHPTSQPPAYSVDFESYYDKEVSIVVQGVDGYLRSTDVYLVSIYGPGISFVGHPSGAPWGAIHGKQWLSHNRNFDQRVYDFLVREVKDPCYPSAWDCTADLAAYLGVPRSLKDASEALLGIKISKSTRDNMKGKRWGEMSEEFKEEVTKYALDDAILCYTLWVKFSDRWPLVEREVSRLTGRIGWHGLYLDAPSIEEALRKLATVKWEAESRLPWGDYVDAKKGTKVPILSNQWLAHVCREHGLVPPASTAEDNEECAAWEEKYGEQFPWVSAMRDWRKANRVIRLLETMKKRIRPEDSRMGFGIKYFGASTGRWTADSGWNSQNQNKDISFGVDLRGMIKAPEGKKLIIWDLSQIEPRTLAWLSNNTVFLKACLAGMSPYEAHARASMGWKGGVLKKEDPKMYALAKARILALGYGAGWEKFISMAAMYDADACFDEPVTPEQEAQFLDRLEYMAKRPKAVEKDKTLLAGFKEMLPEKRRIWVNSWIQVTDFRESNPEITGLWSRLEEDARTCIGKTYTIGLPSGRELAYRNVSSHGGLTAEVVKNGRWMRVRLYGGLLVENLVQATARDVFAEAKLRLSKTEYGDPILSVHDEGVQEVGLDVPVAPLLNIVRQVPDWIAGLPVDCEAIESNRYMK